MLNYWWIIKFNGRVRVTYFNKIPPIPNIGPYWTKAEALKKLWQWGYGFSRSPSLLYKGGK